MPRNLVDYLREGEVISHTCYGNTYRAVYREGVLVDAIDPGLVFASPTSFANAHLEKGKANGWDKCKVVRDGVMIWLKDLPVIAREASKSDVVIPETKKLKVRTMADIKRALATQTMPTAVAAPVAPVVKPKKKAAAAAAPAATKKTRAAGGGAGSSAPVTVPPPEPSVICAKVVEGTDGLMDVCSTQLMVLDYFKYDGVVYYKEATTQEVFEICDDKSIGNCIGVWDSDDHVLKAPYVECGGGDEEY